MIRGYYGLEPIGEGGFATVFRAQSEALGRPVAVKVLDLDVHDAQEERRFRRECALTGRVSGHPFIVTILDSGLTADGRPYLATDLMAGSLADRLIHEGPLPWPEVTAIGVKIAGALATAHAAGIIHRDVKPPNILLSRYGEPALADFGISLIYQNQPLDITTRALTPYHAPPELLDGAAPTVRTDIYSLASTLYTIAAGRSPFERPEDAENLAPLFLRIARDPVPAIGRAEVPAVLEAVITHALAKDPTDRPASAAELGSRLQGVEEALGVAVTPLPAPGVDAVSPVATDPPAGGVLRTGPKPEPAGPAPTPTSRLVSSRLGGGTAPTGVPAPTPSAIGAPTAGTAPRPGGPPLRSRLRGMSTGGGPAPPSTPRPSPLHAPPSTRPSAGPGRAAPIDGRALASAPTAPIPPAGPAARTQSGSTPAPAAGGPTSNPPTGGDDRRDRSNQTQAMIWMAVAVAVVAAIGAIAVLLLGRA